MGMADHSRFDDPNGPDPGPGSARRDAAPDYPLEETLHLDDPARYGVLFEPTRAEIVSLLLDRAATTSELAEVLGKPKGTVGHHLKALEAAGLVRVVRTKRVRALEAKYYGRTARLFLLHDKGRPDDTARTLSIAAEEAALGAADVQSSVQPAAVAASSAGIRYARIPAERAAEWKERVHQLLTEFTREPRGGSVTYAVVAGLYPTRRRRLAEPGEDGGEG